MPGTAAEEASETDAGVSAGSGVLYVREEAYSTRPFAGLEAMREALRSARSKRKHPVVDPKVITAWNGQMIDAFAYAGLVTGDGRYIETAARAADFLLERLWDGELGLYRIYSDGAVRRRAFQEDYACLIGGLLSLYEASADTRWLVAAEMLTNGMNERFWDSEAGGYYFGEAGGIPAPAHEERLRRGAGIGERRGCPGAAFTGAPHRRYAVPCTGQASFRRLRRLDEGGPRTVHLHDPCTAGFSAR